MRSCDGHVRVLRLSLAILTILQLLALGTSEEEDFKQITGSKDVDQEEVEIDIPLVEEIEESKRILTKRAFLDSFGSKPATTVATKEPPTPAATTTKPPASFLSSIFSSKPSVPSIPPQPPAAPSFLSSLSSLSSLMPKASMPGTSFILAGQWPAIFPTLPKITLGVSVDYAPPAGGAASSLPAPAPAPAPSIFSSLWPAQSTARPIETTTAKPGGFFDFWPPKPTPNPIPKPPVAIPEALPPPVSTEATTSASTKKPLFPFGLFQPVTAKATTPALTSSSPSSPSNETATNQTAKQARSLGTFWLDSRPLVSFIRLLLPPGKTTKQIPGNPAITSPTPGLTEPDFGLGSVLIPPTIPAANSTGEEPVKSIIPATDDTVKAATSELETKTEGNSTESGGGSGAVTTKKPRLNIAGLDLGK